MPADDVTTRLGRLDRDRPVLRPVLRAAAALRSADPQLVGPLAGVPPRLAAVALAEMARAGLLRPGADQPVPPGVLAALAAELADLREPAARLLNDTGQPAEAVAAQLLHLPALAEPWMVDVLVEAARAVQAERPAEALPYWRRLAQLRPDCPEAALALAAATTNVDAPAALARLRSALDQHGADVRLRARVAIGIGRAVLAGAAEPAAPALLADSLAAFTAELGDGPRLRDKQLRAELESVLAAVAARGLPHSPARATRPPRAPVAGSGPYQVAANALVSTLDGSDGARAVAYARQVASTEPWPALTAARVLHAADQTAPALQRLGELVAGHRRRQEPWAECRARGVRALALHHTGQLDAAQRDVDRALRLAAGELRCSAASYPALIASAALLMARSRVDRAQRVLDDLAGQPVPECVWDTPRLLLVRAEASLWQGDVDRGLAGLRECGRWLAGAGIGNPQLAPWWVTAVLVHRQLGRDAAAAALAEEYGERCERWGTPLARGLALLARGAVAPGEARLELLHAGAQALRTTAAPGHLGAALVFLGRALYQHGDQAGARQTLREAVVLAARHGHTTLAAHARNVLTAAGGRAATLDSCAALTASERTVAELAAGGATNRQISERLAITVRTVEFHLTNVYRRHGLRRRRDLAGILGTPS